MARQTTNGPIGLAGLRVLVVEDEALLAMTMEDMLADLKCELVGPAGRIAVAVDLAGTELLDGALLDVNVGGAQVFPVAQKLHGRGIPFIFVSGYGPETLPAEWRDRPMLRKPFAGSDLAKYMEEFFRAAV
jgi:DNA-binding response OmpR family regulator